MLTNLRGFQASPPDRAPALSHDPLPPAWSRKALTTLHGLLRAWTAPELLVGLGLGQVGFGLGRLVGWEAAASMGIGGRATLWAARGSGVLAESFAWTAVGFAGTHPGQPHTGGWAQNWGCTAAVVGSLRWTQGALAKHGPWALGLGAYLSLVGSQRALGATGLAEDKPMPQILRESLALLLNFPVAGLAVSKLWGTSLAKMELAFQTRRFSIQNHPTSPSLLGTEWGLEMATPSRGAWSAPDAPAPKGPSVFKSVGSNDEKKSRGHVSPSSPPREGSQSTPRKPERTGEALDGRATSPLGTMRQVQERMDRLAARGPRLSVPLTPGVPAAAGTIPNGPIAPKGPPSTPAPAPSSPPPPLSSLRLVSEFPELLGSLHSKITGSPKGFNVEILLNRRTAITAKELMEVSGVFQRSPLGSTLAIHDPQMGRSFLFDRNNLKILGDRRVWPAPPQGVSRLQVNSLLGIFQHLSFLKDIPRRSSDFIRFDLEGNRLPAQYGAELTAFLNVQIPKPFPTLQVQQGLKLQEFHYDLGQGRWLVGPWK